MIGGAGVCVTAMRDAASDGLTSTQKAAPLVEIKQLSVRFGGVQALDEVSFSIARGTVCGLIGPNGAGKTTLFNCISRIYTPSAGTISIAGQDILQLPVHRMADVGVGRTFQNLALFPTMTVFENILIGSHRCLKPGFVSAALDLRSLRRRESDEVRKVERLVELVGLSGQKNMRVGDLSFGFSKKVEIARALASNPTLLLLDEPAAGLNFEEVTALRNLIRQLCDDEKITILLVEHHMNLVMRVSDQVVVLNFGRKIADDVPAVVQTSADVIQAYLGDGE
jgi:branched-chain amino acid transport system ATP-binding protein